ncbi:hypothetical protein KDL01_19365 [Actinospica durhamensis]|uniref:WXG100 family type VII secretion target n=1 Tax=Actinospica durhamensis TaxID=1508375 RepID=A0A941ES13_9ACTN|nr:hypothetical protein [Actinospica durhamensis]MBR7835443.1 hypothetical protein [Actinospica durhamensis]
MIGDTARWAALGLADPVPGDPEALATLVQCLAAMSDALGQESARLGGIGVDQDGIQAVWTGPQARTFAASHSELTVRVKTAQQAFADALEALAAWQSHLEVLQQNAHLLLGQAEAAPAEARFVVEAEHAQLEQNATEQASACAAALDRAVELIGAYLPHRSWWDEVTGFVDSFVDDVLGFVGALSDVLNEINNWMSIAALCLAPFPVIGEFVDAVALVTSATQAGADVVLFAAGRKSLMQVGEDIGGLALNYAGDGIGGERVTSGVKEADDAAKAAAKESENAAKAGVNDGVKVGQDAAKAGPHHDELAATGAKETKAPKQPAEARVPKASSEAKAPTETKAPKAPTEAKAPQEAGKPSVFRAAAHTTVHPVERIRNAAEEVADHGYGKTMKGWLDTRNKKIVSGHLLQLGGKGGDVAINWLGGDDSTGQGGSGQGGTG